jgi:hypothetical protein
MGDDDAEQHEGQPRHGDLGVIDGRAPMGRKCGRSLGRGPLDGGPPRALWRASPSRHERTTTAMRATGGGPHSSPRERPKRNVMGPR